MCRGSPPLTPAPSPGLCTECVPSKTAGASHASRSSANERMSTTRFPYPKKVPRSVTATAPDPAPRTFSTAPRISAGAIHCPFFTFTGSPVSPAARSRSVCRQRNAGIWIASTTPATSAHCSGR